MGSGLGLQEINRFFAERPCGVSKVDMFLADRPCRERQKEFSYYEPVCRKRQLKGGSSYVPSGQRWQPGMVSLSLG